ncbi:MAG: hypothetical protein QGG54_13155 [Gammaproteobacteria bacterium]|jgi:hypothetical protein|nr:hypothetical protein [Gammaproteobacteria bacterium]|tara:strand:+ start:341 stop:643 length:303 start_codon:yes stop_codon:yes gene_type:complete
MKQNRTSYDKTPDVFDKSKSYLINQFGDITEWKEEHSLENWQAAVGGYVQVIPSVYTAHFSTDHVFLADEEGLFKDYLVNQYIKNGIVGNVLVIPGESFT